MTFGGPAWLVRSAAVIGNAATVIALILLYLEYSGRLAIWDPRVYLAVDTSLCLVMIAEWFTLLVLVDDKRAYLKARWIDLLASIPLLLIARPFRIIRLLRILRLLRGVALFRRAIRPWETAFNMSLLKTVALTASVVVLVASLLVVDLERENPDLNTFGGALWWAIVTSTTVGYGDRVPATAGGQFIAVLLMILGIGLFGSLAATLTTALTSRGKKEVTNEDVLELLELLREEVDVIRHHLLRTDQAPRADSEAESDAE